MLQSVFPPPALGERRHRGLARLRIAVRGACDFSWMSRLAKGQQQPPRALANADHGKAVCATLLPKPDLPKPVSHKASAVANRLLSRERGSVRRRGSPGENIHPRHDGRWHCRVIGRQGRRTLAGQRSLGRGCRSSRLARRLRKVYRRRNREVGQSDQVCGRQGGMIREAGDRCSINPARECQMPVRPNPSGSLTVFVCTHLLRDFASIQATFRQPGASALGSALDQRAREREIGWRSHQWTKRRRNEALDSLVESM